jgi:hypothetical protein
MRGYPFARLCTEINGTPFSVYFGLTRSGKFRSAYSTPTEYKFRYCAVKIW